MNINKMTNTSYECSCGRTHSVEIEKIAICENAIDELLEYIKNKKYKKVQIICDETTYKIAGKDINERLANSKIYIIKEKNNTHVAPNDATIGEVLCHMDNDMDFFLAVGSGVINDTTRQISYKMQREYAVFGTAPSMDGYASVTSSLIINNIKESIIGQTPKAIFADTKILTNAPFKMLTAGFGDVIGKYNAIREWEFSRDLNGEHYCKEIVSIVNEAVIKCENNAKGLKERKPEAVINVMEALIIAGMCMGMYQNTRPASGAEHHIVHYWDVDCIKKGIEHPLHGNSVGVGTVLICQLFELLKGKLPVEVMELNTDKIINTLKLAGGPTSPIELNISRELLKESIIKGHTMSAKYTVLTYLSKENPELLEEVAEELCNMYY